MNDKVVEFLKPYNMDQRIMTSKECSATVQMAAKAFNTSEERIAKSLSFKIDNRIILIVTSGDMKIDNHKYKDEFKQKAHMLLFDEVLDKVGHPVGGVCPFAVNEGVEIYLDESLKRFPTVFPACGSAYNAIEITIEELNKVVKPIKWVDVCKNNNL